LSDSSAVRRRPQRRGRYVGRDELAARLALSSDTLEAARARFPVQWPRAYLDLVGEDPANDPIARMGRPSAAELEPHGGDIADPIADQLLRPVPFVVRKHRDRVIILAAKKCHFYCRFCFRREEPVAKAAEPDRADWARIFDFLRAHPEIEEPILSGGDPLTLDNDTLFWVRDRLRAIPSVRRWRIHSRAPVHFPIRVNETLLAGLAAGLETRLVTHYNHVREIGREAGRIAALAARCGVGYENQAVLLAGVNDSAAAQAALWRGLLDLGLAPRYLHHPDRAPGNAAFRLTIARGLAIYREFLANHEGPAPIYALDLPDGSGKVPVTALEPLGGGLYRYIHQDGRVSRYQDIAGRASIGSAGIPAGK